MADVLAAGRAGNPVTPRSETGERSSCSAGAQLLREYLLRVDVDRRKRIDGYIDYFGNGSARDGIPRRATPWGGRDSDGASGVSRPRPAGGPSG